MKKMLLVAALAALVAAPAEAQFDWMGTLIIGDVQCHQNDTTCTVPVYLHVATNRAFSGDMLISWEDEDEDIQILDVTAGPDWPSTPYVIFNPQPPFYDACDETACQPSLALGAQTGYAIGDVTLHLFNIRCKPTAPVDTVIPLVWACGLYQGQYKWSVTINGRTWGWPDIGVGINIDNGSVTVAQTGGGGGCKGSVEEIAQCQYKPKEIPAWGPAKALYR